MTTFADLKLIEPLQKALTANDYTHPTAIQAKSIPALLQGRDVVGCAQTGTGKTAAFALPVLQHISQSEPSKKRVPKALILSPTRELAAQIGESFQSYGRFLKTKQVVIFGGVNEKPQIARLKEGVDIIVATPGRLIDLGNQGYVDLSNVGFFVLDEADRMLDMGFLPDIKRIMKQLPAKRQNLLFSATMPKAIEELANSFLDNPVRVEVQPQSSTVEKISQQVMFVAKNDKPGLLMSILKTEDVGQAIVFTRTKHGANKVHKKLLGAGFKAEVIHGNKSQGARNSALDAFRNGKSQLLIATDIASRGIDVEEITHVFNFDLPNDSENYVHRIGRTGRAGRSGSSISFCDETETGYLKDIEKIIGENIPQVVDHDFHMEEALKACALPAPKKKKSGRGFRPRNSSPRNSSQRSRRTN